MTKLKKVLNLVLNGYSLKFKSIILGLSEKPDEVSFKPCFKWLLPKIHNVRSIRESIKLNICFKPCFKWLLPKITISLGL